MGKTRKKLRRSLESKNLTRTTIVITVYNEQDNIGKLVELLLSQTVKPAEIIVVDGGSSDSTYSTLKQLAQKHSVLKVYKVKGNRSVGRNYGVAHSATPVIAFTDAGCTPNPNWLEKLITPFSDPKTQVVSGYYKGLALNNFQKSLIPFVLVMPDKAGKSEFFPSTRSMAIRRSAWNNSGGFDTRLSHNEDFAYANWLKKMGYSFIFAPEAVVSWHPRKNLSEAAWMFLRFALGDSQSGILRPKVKLVFIRYLFFSYLFLLSREYNNTLAVFLPVIAAYLVWAIVKNYRHVKHVSALFWLPVLQVTSDLMVMAGTIMGFLNKK